MEVGSDFLSVWLVLFPLSILSSLMPLMCLLFALVFLF